MRRSFVLLCALVLSLVWVTPANATTPKRVKPSAPTAVAVVAGTTPGQAVLSWSSPADQGSRKVFGYSVVKKVDGVSSVYWQKAHRSKEKAYSRTFSTPVPGAVYAFTVLAWTEVGGSPVVRVTYQPPALPGGATVYSVDTATGSLVTVPAGGGKPTTVVSGATISDLTADGAGGVYFADKNAHTVSRIAAGSTTVTTVASGLAGPRTIVADAAGAVYIADGPTVRKITAAGVASVVFTAPTDIYDVAVSPNGVLSVDFGAFESSDVTVATVSPDGTVKTRTLECGFRGYCSDLLVDGTGTLYVQIYASGASGFRSWYRVPAGSTTPEAVVDTLSEFAVTLDAKNVLTVLATQRLLPRPQ